MKTENLKLNWGLNTSHNITFAQSMCIYEVKLNEKNNLSCYEYVSLVHGLFFCHLTLLFIALSLSLTHFCFIKNGLCVTCENWPITLFPQ